MQVMHHKVHGDFKMPAWPVRFGGAPLPVAPAPLLGQHNDEVLGEWLGLSAKDAAKLRKDGVI
jgi:crotonobetainyl-CoA:carnitine CoA-transferase CaiB-like acyl-CoA transferase